MKIAVLNINGIQNTRDGQLVHYFRVDDDYDFVGNSSTDVTTFDTVDLFIQTNRINYIEYREWLINFNSTSTFSNLTPNQKEVLVKNFATSKSNRDSVMDESQQRDFSEEIQILINNSNKTKNFRNNSSTIVNEEIPTFTNSTTSALFGSYIGETSSESETSTNSDTYQNKLTLTTPNIPEGKYKISWSFEYNGNTNRYFQSRVILDDLYELMDTSVKVGDNLNWLSNGGFKYQTLDSGVHTIKIDFKANNNTNIKIRRARLDICRIS